MSNEIAVQNASTEIQQHEQQQPFIDIRTREAFVKKLDAKPPRVEKSNGAETVPISHLEHELDEIYMGIWKTSNFRHAVVCNEIVGTIDLHVFDPTLRTWLTRSGSAAVLIRQQSGAAISDIGAKIKNGLMMDFPKLESMCLKKAAKSLGKRFGRDLNRKFEDGYEEHYSAELDINEQYEQLKDKIIEGLKKQETVDGVLSYWKTLPELHENFKVKALFTNRKLDIQNGII